MAKYWNQYHNQRGGAFAALMVLLLPALFPSLFAPFGYASPSILSEWNAPKPRHLSLLKSALQRESSDEQKSELWSPLAPQGWRQCAEAANSAVLPEKSTGYIQVFLDGGLNQQRMGVCDAVAVTKILNATLVIPQLEVNPVWKDSSSFEEIFDVDHFINVLKDDISIARKLPDEFSWSTREYYAVAIRATRIKTAPVHASANWYLDNVIPVLQRRMQNFEIGAKVLVQIRPERFSMGTIKKLHARRIGPYEIVKKIGPNAYEIDIPRDMGISPMFNVEDLSPYHESEEFPATIQGLLLPSPAGDSSPEIQSSPVPPQPSVPSFR